MVVSVESPARTFLFTDIEGSTRLWERFPEAMPGTLARHDDLLRQAIQNAGGVVFKTVGDSFCACFDNAASAVAAAARVQRALYTADWTIIGGVLRVRIALHAGEAHERDHDYFGPALNRLARLLDAAHGGQTLLSQAVQRASANALPEGAALRDLGLHGLKDLAQPERIFQLILSELPADFPPVRSLELQPNNLPLQNTRFIGREITIEQVRQHVKTNRLVTLTGPGGAGKTRLALQVAADFVGKVADGVWLVELAARTDDAAVWQAVAQTLQVRAEPDRPLADTLTDFLRARDLLLLLDNCEHLIDACASLADRVLRACPQVRILATSRESLAVPGEIAHRVPSLSLPASNDPALLSADKLPGYEALQLFVDRASAAAPQFTVLPEELPILTEICRRLDGIPLAIELAAARVRVLSLTQIVERIGDHLRLLTGGSRTLLPRQQTLRALIDWSYDLLADDEIRLFRRLAVFSGGWTIEAAETVGADDENEAAHVLDVLSRLVDKSLVVAELVEQELVQQPERGRHLAARYRFLETIRQYAAEKLRGSGEAQTLRIRHRDWCLQLAETLEPQMRGPRQAVCFDHLEIEHDNLRAALEWCCAEINSGSGDDSGGAAAGLRLAGILSRFWYVRGYLSEGRAWLETLLSDTTTRAVPGTVRATAVHAAAGLARDQGDYHRAARLYDDAIRLRARLNDPIGAATSRQQRGAVAADQGDYDLATQLLAGSYDLFHQSSYLRGMAISRNFQGAVHMARGDWETASQLLAESLSLSRRIGERWGAALALHGMGQIRLAQNDADQAARLFQEALDLYEETGDKRGIALALGSRGAAAWQAGQSDQAAAQYRDALVRYRAVGDKRGIATCLSGLALVCAGRENWAAALTLEAAADSLRIRIGAPLPLWESVLPAPDRESARAALDENRFDAAQIAGQRLSLDEAVALALTQTA